MSVLRELGFRPAAVRERTVFEELIQRQFGSAEVHLVVPDFIAPTNVAAARALTTVSVPLGWRPRITTSRSDPARVAEAVGLAAADNAIGLITVETPPPRSLTTMVPTVLVGRPEHGHHPTVEYDPHAAPRRLAWHLQDGGHRRVLLVATTSLIGPRRAELLRPWMGAKRLEVTLESAEDTGDSHLRELLADPAGARFSAVVVDNDDVAKAIQDRLAAGGERDLPTVCGYNSDGTSGSVLSVDNRVHERIADAVAALRGQPVPSVQEPVLRLPEPGRPHA